MTGKELNGRIRELKQKYISAMRYISTAKYIEMPGDAIPPEVAEDVEELLDLIEGDEERRPFPRG